VITQEFDLGDHRSLVISRSVEKPVLPWLVYIPGSGDHFNDIEKIESLQILLAYHDYNFLIINKVGVAPNGDVDKEAFQRGSLRGQRIQDNLSVMKAIIPADAKVQLMALSEGAYIAPEIAEKDSRIKSLILLSGNTWSWLEEEVNYLPPPQRAALRTYLETEVLPNPVFDKFYRDWSYAYFNSYCTDATYITMKSQSLPTLAIHGGKDDIIWLEGTLENLKKLTEVEKRTNIEVHLLPEANHSLRCGKNDQRCKQRVLSKKLKAILIDFAKRTL